ncbi:MAG TPA: sigma-70 family RNA polymerase sigma factor [Symbiobacteriaceae bacterium]|nr:sigma-70 family RNA polymerase sigma factor [Symbiobacteriaceae bacterium]
MQDDLYLRLMRRDPSAMELLVRQFIAPVHRLAGLILGQTGTPEDVEEIASDAFARAWERIAEYDPERTTLASWVLMITKYTALDYRRRMVRRSYTADGQAKVIPLDAGPEPAAPNTPEEDLLRQDQSERVREALNRLPEAERTLLVRRYFLEEPITDIARDLGLTRTAMDNRLSRARQALKAQLADQKGVLEIV